jgi:hypothetical protein
LGFVGNSPKKKNQTMFSNGNGFCQPTTGKQESAGHFWCESWSHRRDMLKFVKIQSDFTCWILLDPVGVFVCKSRTVPSDRQ